MIKSFLFSILFFIVISLSAQEDLTLELDTIHFSGKYTGKNLFVKNQFSENEKGFSVRSIILNEEEIPDDLNATDFEINLSSRDRKIGDDLNIAIIYLKGKKPEILNLDDLGK